MIEELTFDIFMDILRIEGFEPSERNQNLNLACLPITSYSLDFGLSKLKEIGFEPMKT